MSNTNHPKSTLLATLYVRLLAIGLVILFFLSSCTPQSKLVYLQKDGDKLNDTTGFELTLEKGDMVSIQVITVNPDAFPGIGIAMADKQVVADNRSPYEKGFLINEKGNLELPYVGAIQVSGLTMSAAREKVAAAFRKYIDEPVVLIKKLNFRFSILGEVNKPGWYTVPGEQLTFTEALAMAGDLSNFGDRTAIKIFRKRGNQTIEIPVDLTSKAALAGEIKYIYPDDLIYVQAVKRKALANISPGLTVVTSIVTTLVVIATLMVNLNNN